MLRPVKINTNDNIVYYCFPKRDYISYCLKHYGEYEPEIKVVSKLIFNNKSGTVIDIGANIGTYCLPLAKTFPNLNFKAFEIQKKIIQILNKNIKINNIKNVYSYNVGLSNKKNEIDLKIPDYNVEKNIGGFSIDRLINSKYTTLNSVNNYSIKERFKLKTLDDFNLKKIILIKLDVEGHELEVLQGSKKTIIRNKYPVIIFENHYREKKNKIENFLKKLGYKFIKWGITYITYTTEDLNIDFVKSYVRAINERDKFNPSKQGLRYHAKNILPSLQRSLKLKLR